MTDRGAGGPTHGPGAAPVGASAPRIGPILPQEMNEGAREVLAVMGPRGAELNITRTLAHFPKASVPYLQFNKVLLFECTLPMRLREIAVLRLAHLSHCEYEWFQHIRIGGQHGLTARDFDAILAGAPAPDWSELDAMMLEAVDQLNATDTLDDGLWARLSRYFDRREMMELLFIIGAYKMSAWIFNAVGVQIES
jgi:alkylhydroperoxidase family enzyme